MTDIDKNVKVPQESNALAQGLKTFIEACIQEHKTNPSLAVEVSADLAEALKDFGSVLLQAGMLGDEAKSEPIGVAESFAIAGFELARDLTGK